MPIYKNGLKGWRGRPGRSIEGKRQRQIRRLFVTLDDATAIVSTYDLSSIASVDALILPHHANRSPFPTCAVRRRSDWACRTRTRKCRFRECYLKCRANSLTFRNIFAPETFRGKPQRAGCGSRWGLDPLPSLTVHELRAYTPQPRVSRAVAGLAHVTGGLVNVAVRDSAMTLLR
jgi:hypothetical protein